MQFLCLPAEDAVQLDCSCISIGNIRSGHSLGVCVCVCVCVRARACVCAGSYPCVPICLQAGMARALFSYQAQSAEELSFHEGALIRLLRCRQGEVCKSSRAIPFWCHRRTNTGIAHNTNYGSAPFLYQEGSRLNWRRISVIEHWKQYPNDYLAFVGGLQI